MGSDDLDLKPNDSSDSPSVVGESDSTVFQELLARVASVPPPSLLPEGSMVGEYRISKQLGRGAFGAVYHASHAIIGKQVALKVLGAQFSEDAAMAARFVDEARAVNRIGHPNIVDIFGFGVLPDGRKYCVMELLRGTTLAERLHQSGQLQPAETLEILGQISSALDAAHTSGIVHRDLKPENVFLCSSGSTSDATIKVKLLDFGIAQIADGLHQRTGSNMVLGTPAYMSPEQCRGARIDFRSDIYSLGVVAFELLTGTQPFQGNNAFQLTSQHLTAEPPAPSSLQPSLSEAVDEVILGMLAKSPDARPQTASAAVAKLADAFGMPVGPASSAVSVSLSERQPAKRQLPYWLLGGAVALIAGLAVAMRFPERSAAPTAPAIKPAAAPAKAERPAPSVNAAPAPVEAPAAAAPDTAAAGATAPSALPTPSASAAPKKPKRVAGASHRNPDLEY